MSIPPQLAAACAGAKQAGPDLWAAGSTLVGAVVGGLIAAGAAFWTANRTMDEARRAADRVQLDHDRTSAMRATTTLLLLTNSLAGYDGQLKEMLEKGRKDLGPAHPWRYVLGMVGNKSSVTAFDVSDLVTFMKAGQGGFASELVMLAGRYGPLSEAFSEYAVRRDRLLEKLSADKMDGHKASGDFTPKEMAYLAPRMDELNHMIDELATATAELLATARDLSKRMGPLCQTVFKDPRWPAMLELSASAASQADLS